MAAGVVDLCSDWLFLLWRFGFTNLNRKALYSLSCLFPAENLRFVCCLPFFDLYLFNYLIGGQIKNKWVLFKKIVDINVDDTVLIFERRCLSSSQGPTWDGRSGVHVHMTNTRITDPEIIERR